MREQMAGDSRVASLQTTYDAILPAGGRITGRFAQEAGTEIKALIRLGGRTLLQSAVEALRATGRVRRIVVAGGDATRLAARAVGADGTVEERESLPANILHALDWLRAQPGGVTPRVLTVTTDLPFLTPAAIREFLDRCPPNADVVLPVVTQAAFEARFPGLANDYTRLVEGAFAPGGVMRIDTETLARTRPLVERLVAARKSPIQMAKVAGVGILGRYLMGRLSVEHLIARAHALVGCSGAVVYDAPPELAYDIDLMEEYVYARRMVEAGAVPIPQHAEPKESLR